jgi:peptide deformylase
MAVLPILHYPDDRLRRESEPVDTITDEIQTLIDDMIETMYAAPGVGLAAPQVGVSKQIMVVDISVGKDPTALRVMINPQIVASAGEKKEEEGCLSVPEFSEEVPRAESLEVRYLTREGQEQTLRAEGLLAKAIQHEVDHLKGGLFMDRLSALKRDMIKRKIRKAMRQGSYE